MHRHGGTGTLGFRLDSPCPESELSAVWKLDDLSVPLPVCSSGVELEADPDAPGARLPVVAPAAENPIYAVEYPVAGAASGQTLTIIQGGKHLKSIQIDGSTPTRSKRLMDKASSFLGVSAAPPDDRVSPCLAAHHDDERVNVDLIGFYPIDDTFMVMRVRVDIPPVLGDYEWHWTFYGSKTDEEIPRPKTIYSSVDDNGAIVLIVSVMMPRTITSGIFLVHEKSNRVFPGFLGVNEQFRDERLRDFYELTTDVKADESYPAWFAAHRATQMQLAHQQATTFAHAPKVSIIIPVYEPPIPYLDACVRSVLAQTYTNWELVLVNASPDHEEGCGYLDQLAALDDERIVIVELEGNRGIAGNTNAGIIKSSGDYFAFCDQDDVLEPDALYEYIREIDAHPETDLLYCDEDSFENDLSGVYGAMLKPDFDEDFMYGHNFVVHLLMVSREALLQVSPSGDHLSGAQDYDLTLKVFPIARRIVHIPRVLYHWREHENSTNSGNLSVKPYAEKAGRDALAEHFERRGISATVEICETPAVYKCIFDVPEGNPALEVFVMDSGDEDELERCRAALQEQSAYDNLALTVVKSREEADAAAKASEADFIMFVDSGIEAVTGGCLETLLGYFQRGDVGAVGPLVMFADGPIFHAGLALMADGSVGHMNRFHTLATNKGYLGSTECTRQYSAVSGTCVMMRKSAYVEVGGYDLSLTADYADLDLGWKMDALGYRTVYTPHVHFTYHLSSDLESAAAEEMCRALGNLHEGPGLDDKIERSRSRGVMQARYPEYFALGDPHINPNCSKGNPYYALGW